MLLPKSVLIVDDMEINRLVLQNILSEDYDIITACNGKEAFEVLEKNHDIIAIILDLVMPVMGGFEFLSLISKKEELKDIPIIVSTGNSQDENEVRALISGAWDFIRKPYVPEVIRVRLANVIARSKLTAFAQIKYLAEFDTLTDIFNQTKFFNYTKECIDKELSDKNRKMALMRLDINNFSLINTFFGFSEGDKVLKHFANSLREYAIDHPVISYARMDTDVFTLCVIYENEKELIDCYRQISKMVKLYQINFDIVVNCGVCIIEKNVSIENTYDRATLAAKKCKGSYNNGFLIYTDSMAIIRKKEQEITSEMNYALNSGQFEVYFQPKYNIATGLPEGAEALIRWRHPEKGLIPPGEFIEVFEKNGFISKLDYFVWESTCKLIRKWLDAGITVHPISVNVSRVDIYNPKLLDLVGGLVTKYNVPINLLHLEITESVYVADVEKMQSVIDKLHDYGFVIIMDDFGSGYSSLNVLKDIVVDILKIDMRFFGKTANCQRSAKIISSVLRMAKDLKTITVAEGVEEESQIRFLKKCGCKYVQGYFYARPMPVSDYENNILKCKGE